MANSITLAERFLPILDGIYKRESLTARLLGANANIRFTGGNAVEVFKTDMNGFANYSRSNGFVTGSVTAGWDKYQLAKDRGISLTVDAMDDEETLGMAFGTLASEFIRTKEVPELDAYRFAVFASTTGISSASAAIQVGTTDCVDLIDTAEQVMGDNEVPVEGRILFVSETFYHGIKAKITRYLANESGVQREVEMFNGMEVVRVPKGRFNTGVTLYDGTSNFGFVPASGSYPINFMIIHPSAVLPIVKHEVPRIWTPAQNINADAYKFDLRVYHDAFVMKEKKAGIYCHYSTSANA